MTQLHADILLRARAKIEGGRTGFVCNAIRDSSRSPQSKELIAWIRGMLAPNTELSAWVRRNYWVGDGYPGEEQMRSYRLRWLDEYLIPTARKWK